MPKGQKASSESPYAIRCCAQDRQLHQQAGRQAAGNLDLWVHTHTHWHDCICAVDDPAEVKYHEGDSVRMGRLGAFRCILMTNQNGQGLTMGLLHKQCVLLFSKPLHVLP